MAFVDLPAAVQKVLGAPLPVRKMAAKGAAPGLKPSDVLHALVALSDLGNAPAAANLAEWAELAMMAQNTLRAPPAPLVKAALSGALDPRVLDALADAADFDVVSQVVLHADTQDDTLGRLARGGSERLTELLATNETRLLKTPALIEALYKNPNTRMSTADRIVELAIRNGLELAGIPAFREVVQALQGELVSEASDQPTPDDEAFVECAQLALDADVLGENDMHEVDESTGTESVKPQFVEQAKAFDKLPISGRVRRAQVGKASDRNRAFRDPSPLVRKAAAKSELLNESEVLLVTNNRSTAEDVLRVLGTDREWTRHHKVKLNLVMNPRTPFDVAARFVSFLRDHELKQLAASKDVPGAIVTQAKQQLQRKGR